MSIENFYWILYENLLKHSELDAWYYHPFGTKNFLSQHEFRTPPSAKQLDHVLFHDQEPIWSNDLGYTYHTVNATWSVKILKILANSEHSTAKKDLCRQQNMLDWYYFYHGFAALNWFRDAQFIKDSPPAKIFGSLNHITTGKRAYRLALTARFFDLDIVHHGDISLHSNIIDIIKEINDPYTMLTDRDKKLITNKLISQPELPLLLDHTDVDGNHSAHLGYKEYGLWQNSFLHVVNETVFYDSKLHLTEKIFKPIVCLRPFVLVAAPGNLAYLRSYGFETFSNWIDESYDQETDHERRLDLIASEVDRICQLPSQQLADTHRQMAAVLEHNKKHFYGNFRKIIVNELVDNFANCLKIWNHARLDDRYRPIFPDLELVKHNLSK